MEEDAKQESPILTQLGKNTQFLINLRESVSKLEKRLEIVLLPPPPQDEDEESKSESKDESKTLRSLMVQSGMICSINDTIGELTARLEV